MLCRYLYINLYLIYTNYLCYYIILIYYIISIKSRVTEGGRPYIIYIIQIPYGSPTLLFPVGRYTNILFRRRDRYFFFKKMTLPGLIVQSGCIYNLYKNNSWDIGSQIIFNFLALQELWWEEDCA